MMAELTKQGIVFFLLIIGLIFLGIFVYFEKAFVGRCVENEQATKINPEIDGKLLSGGAQITGDVNCESGCIFSSHFE